jgi:hypothetical protein
MQSPKADSRQAPFLPEPNSPASWTDSKSLEERFVSVEGQ